MADPTTSKPVVLLAEPTAATAVVIRRALEWANYDVVTTCDGIEAIEWLDHHRPTVAVLEVMMPALNGYEVVRRLRSTPTHRFTPVILTSSRAGKLDRDFAFTVGANEYLKKPFRTNDLVAMVATLGHQPGRLPAPVARPAARLPERAVRRPAAPVLAAH